jgi:peptidoglycan/xylan/chitin deacetylase (PgdA/CDA1 family)
MRPTALTAAAAILLLFVAPAGAQVPGCRFQLGFAALRAEIPAAVGDCLEDERHSGENGDALQRTTGGLLVWRKADNWTAFTDGSRTWVNGPHGLQTRSNAERFDWEGDVARVAVSAEEVVRGDPGRPWISLVFNAGSGYRTATRIADVLKEKSVRTTFFPLGWWVEKEGEFVRRIAADGHEVASHGHRVFDLTAVSDAEVIADLTRAEEVISAVTGRTTKPLWSPSAGYRDARVRRLAASLGYRPIFWTVDSGDWREDATAAGVRRRVLDGAVNGAIIVMHTDSPRSADTVAPMLGDLIDELRGRGLRLVTVTELVTGRPRG